MLQEFLRQCCQIGLLSLSEYELLIKLELEGFEAKEVATLDGELSATAVHPRIQSIVTRLRQAALPYRRSTAAWLTARKPS